jgi:hypothetical protein
VASWSAVRVALGVIAATKPVVNKIQMAISLPMVFEVLVTIDGSADEGAVRNTISVNAR